MVVVLDRDRSIAPAEGPSGSALTPARRRSGLIGLVARWWPVLLVLVAFCAYLAVGLWLLAVGNYAINDSLVRSANARVILFSRDPHLAALGAVWMPLPVLVQIPVVAVLQPFGLAWASSVVYSAGFMAAAVGLLVVLGRRLGLRDPRTALIATVFAFSPVVWLWGALGMTEANFFFLAALASLFYLRWSETRGVRELGALGLTLGLETLTRQEGIVLAVVFAGVVAVQTDRGRRLGVAVVVLLPSIFTMVVWMAAQQILRGDALHWYKVASIIGRPPRGASWLPAERTLATSAQFVLQRVLHLAPVVLVVVPLVLFDEVSRRRRQGRGTTLTGGAVVGVGLASTAFMGALFATGRLWGNPRYFLGILVSSFIGVMWLLRPGGRFASRLWAGVAAVALVVSAATGLAYEVDPKATAVEREDVAIKRLVGVLPPGDISDQLSNNAIATYKRVAEIVDQRSRPGDLIAIDTAIGFTTLLYTRHLGRFAVPEDRDFEQLVALPDAPFSFLVLTYGNGLAPADLNDDFQKFLTQEVDGRRWQLVEKVSSFAEVYQLMPAPASPGGNPP